MTNENKLDQFYTNEDVAKKYYDIFIKTIDCEKIDFFIEPSAGTGSFYKLIDPTKRVGLDLEPKCEGIIKMNYFDFEPIKYKKYAIIGNPPFGRVSSTAVKFFNKSAEFAEYVAFIIPRTFKRVSIQNNLDLNFELIYNDDLPLIPCCFTPKMSAKCCFQIWKRAEHIRTKVKYDKTHPDFIFVKHGPLDEKKQPTPPENVDFALKAYGCNCGEIKDENLKLLRPKSWHWIKSNINIDELKNRFKTLNYSMSKDTVRQDSLGQKELIHLYKIEYN